MSTKVRLDAQSKRRICAEAMCAERTLEHYLDDRASVREASAVRIERAAATLGIELPTKK